MDYRDGALYSPRPFEGRVVRVDLATKEVTNVTTGWGVPIAVKFDSQGHLYAANQGNGELVRIDLTNPNTTTNREVIATLPVGWFDNLAFDKDDRLYISSASDATVLEVLPGGGFRTVSPGGMSLSTGLTVVAAPCTRSRRLGHCTATTPRPGQSGARFAPCTASGPSRRRRASPAGAISLC